MTTWKHKWTHYLGVSASLLCLVHCLALPLVLVVFPAVTSLDLRHIDTTWEIVFVALSIVSIYTIVQMHRTHKKFSAALPVAFAGAALLTIALFLDHLVAAYVLPIGSILILAAHVLNLKYCSTHSNCHKNCAHTNAVPQTLQ